MTTQQELVKMIAELETEMTVTRKKLIEIRKEFDNTESKLISSKLKKEELVDQLRRIQAADINQPPTLRELDIAAFRERHPAILAALKEKDKK
jgi:septal ring factor EnvC (AmiA/AmiB activator)